MAILSDTRCWLQGLVLETTQYRYQGEVHTKRQVVAKDNEPPAVAAIATRLLLRAKHFHMVSFGNRHEHLLKSRHGKVSFVR